MSVQDCTLFSNLRAALSQPGEALRVPKWSLLTYSGEKPRRNVRENSKAADLAAFVTGITRCGVIVPFRDCFLKVSVSGVNQPLSQVTNLHCFGRRML